MPSRKLSSWSVIFGLFIAALAYLEYQRILSVDWHKVQAISQNGIDWLADALTHVSSQSSRNAIKYWDSATGLKSLLLNNATGLNNPGTTPGTLSNIGIAGFKRFSRLCLRIG
jgi:hypothetical protein